MSEFIFLFGDRKPTGNILIPFAPSVMWKIWLIEILDFSTSEYVLEWVGSCFMQSVNMKNSNLLSLLVLCKSSTINKFIIYFAFLYRHQDLTIIPHETYKVLKFK